MDPGGGLIGYMQALDDPDCEDSEGFPDESDDESDGDAPSDNNDEAPSKKRRQERRDDVAADEDPVPDANGDDDGEDDDGHDDDDRVALETWWSVFNQRELEKLMQEWCSSTLCIGMFFSLPVAQDKQGYVHTPYQFLQGKHKNKHVRTFWMTTWSRCLRNALCSRSNDG